jgi:hypothetical protein
MLLGVASALVARSRRKGLAKRLLAKAATARRNFEWMMIVASPYAAIALNVRAQCREKLDTTQWIAGAASMPVNCHRRRTGNLEARLAYSDCLGLHSA